MENSDSVIVVTIRVTSRFKLGCFIYIEKFLFFSFDFTISLVSRSEKCTIHNIKMRWFLFFEEA